MAALDWLAPAAVATLGTWWFAFVLKGLKSLAPGPRRLVFAMLWIAYFVLTRVLVRLLAARGG